MIKITELLINGVDYSDYATVPLQMQETLDESLDVGYIELKGLDNGNPFVPFSNVYLKIDNKEYYLLVESDEVIEVVSNKTHDHNLLIIEETKWLERFFVEKSFTQPLLHEYIKGQTILSFDNVYDEVYEKGNGIEGFMKQNLNLNFLSSPLLLNEAIAIPEVPYQDDYYWRFVSGDLTITTPSGNNLEYDLDRGRVIDYVFNEEGKYTLEYNFINTFVNQSHSYSFKIDVAVVNQPDKKDDITIRQVIETLLSTTETLRENEKPRFSLASITEYNESENYKERVKKIFDTTSPEFYFSKMSLFEALKSIGDYAHFVPRMKNKKIYLDLLGLDEMANIEEEYYSLTASQSTNDFCTKLDSQVNNLVNLDEEAQGSVETPLNNGFRTLRTQEGTVQIKEDNIIIPTESPIEKIIKLEIGYLKNGTYIGDITPYVYENAEYEALSSYDDYFPYSKMYALKYTIGSENITGLSYERPNAISQAFEGIAIRNIINRKVNKGNDWINNLFGESDVFEITYRLVYIPSTTTRVTQSKAYKDNITKTISIAYNQSASKVSSNAYGENLKGQILKLGNIEKSKMYILPNVDLMPKCGDKFDKDYYISVVKSEYYPNFIKCELGLSKDYNNKSAYVEISSQLRFYEISEKIALDSYRIYEDFCEIGFDNETDGNCLITADGIKSFADAFKINGYSDEGVAMVKANSFDNERISRGEFALPVISLGIGNSLLFEFHYKDNYSAGSTATYKQGVKVQQLERYTDDYGEVETLGLKYGKNTTIIDDFESAVNMGDSIPLASAVTEMKTYFDTNGNNILLKKDSAEAIHFTYQIHFVANNNNIIIGSGLARYSPFVTNETLRYKLVLLKNKLNKFENEIDLTNSYHYDSIIVNEPDYENKKISLASVVAPNENEEWKSWAIVQTILNDENNISKAILILGENKDIKSGDIIEMPNFVFKHKIVEE